MIVKFKIKGTCVDDLFHILANNGYLVQMNTSIENDTYICAVIVENLENESEDK